MKREFIIHLEDQVEAFDDASSAMSWALEEIKKAEDGGRTVSAFQILEVRTQTWVINKPRPLL